MKRIILLGTFAFFTLAITYAQDQEKEASKSSIGISSTFLGKANIVYYRQVDGGAGYTGDQYYTFSLNYLYTINRTFQIETGITYATYHFVVTPNYGPPDEMIPYSTNYYQFSVPITIRINFERFFFVNGGFSFDYKVKNQTTYIDQSGIGAILGLGFNYPFKSGLGLFANPYFEIHRLIDFQEGNNAGKLTEAGIRIGATYTFKK